MVGSQPGGAASAERLAALQGANVVERLWAADPTLWKAEEAEHQAVIANSLGWVSVFEGVRSELEGLTSFVDELRAEGYRFAVLLGMGGSSLAPEVFQAVLGTAPGFLELHVLDSTDPAAVAAVEERVDLERTLFVVASKSGGTTETASFHAYFYDRLSQLDGERAGRHFVAITDADTVLQRLAVEQDFRAVFVNPSDIGGRYSALSFFGLVPAALIGVDLERLLDGVRSVAEACGPAVPVAQNPAVQLGVALGEFALAGRDKLTLVFEPPLEPLGAWVEQLVAESTGKEGTGILPVDLEELGPPLLYGDDRVFCAVRIAGTVEPATSRWLGALAEAGQPVLQHEIADAYALGGELLRWELATAVAGYVLGINPFDQPNVQESKEKTKQLLAAYAASGELAEGPSGGEGSSLSVDDEGLPAALRSFFSSAAPGDYVALQAYLAPAEGSWRWLQAVRLLARDGLRVATTLGYGPRYLHSTGQYHKGGPNRGLFVQVLGHDAHDLAIPGQPYGFSVLKRAQAHGDLAALRDHGCRVLRVHLGANAEAGLAHLAEAVARAIEAGGCG